MVIRAKSVGATYRLWRLQRRVDGDVCGVGVSVAATGCTEYFEDLPAADQRRVARIFARAGDDGTVVLSRLDAAQQRRLFDLVRAGEMDGPDLKALARFLRGEGEFVDGSVSPSSLLEVGKKGDLSDTTLIARDGSGRVRWFEHDQIEVKVQKRHGDQFRESYESIETEEEILSVVYEAIKNSDSADVITRPNPGGGIRYFVKVEEGEKPIRIATSENGFIITAHPDKTNIEGFD